MKVHCPGCGLESHTRSEFRVSYTSRAGNRIHRRFRRNADAQAFLVECGRSGTDIVLSRRHVSEWEPIALEAP